MLQGKPKDEREEQAQRAEHERLEKLKIDDEWAGGANSGMPQPCLADLPASILWPEQPSLAESHADLSCWAQLHKKLLAGSPPAGNLCHS